MRGGFFFNCLSILFSRACKCANCLYNLYSMRYSYEQSR